MLFPTSLVAIGFALIPSTFASPFDTSPLKATSLQKRAAVSAPICETLAVALPGATVGGLSVPGISLGTTCICATPAGGLTPGSILYLQNQLASGTNVPLLKALGLTTTTALTQLTAALVPQLISAAPATPRCNYPANAVPTSCSTCDYDCDTNFTKNAAGQCISNATGRKRRELVMTSPGACPNSMLACSVVGISGRRTSQFECLDVRSNIESCGGCMVPFGSQPSGQDCTLIPNVEGVTCTKGRCVVTECAMGLVVDASRSSCVSYVGVESK